MRKLALILLALLAITLPAHAQLGIPAIQLLNGDNSVAQSFQSFFSIKVGATCTWSISGTTATFTCAGAGGAPASPSGSIQYNNSGSFGAIPQWANGKANCDGSMDPCDVFVTQTSTFTYFLAGTNTSAPMGNYFACYQFTDAGVYCNSNDGTDNAQMNFAPGSGNTGMTIFHSSKSNGFDINSINRVLETSRVAFGSSFTTTVTSGAFSLGAGWGSTASVTGQGGSDNAFLVQVTTGGAGIAANPTITYTYVDGDYSTAASSTPAFVCTQTAGSDIFADVTPDAPGQTSTVLTWHGTPTTAKTYTITCHDFQRS